MQERALCFHIQVVNPDKSFGPESARLFALNGLLTGLVKDYVKQYPGAYVVEVAEHDVEVVFAEDHD